MIGTFAAFTKVCVARREFYWQYVDGVSKLQFTYEKNKKTPIYLGDSLIKRHLAGEIVLGLSPFLNETEVLFGAIDFDIHKPTQAAQKSKLKEFNNDQHKLKQWISEELEKQRLVCNKDIPAVCKELTAGNYTYFLNSSGSEGTHLRLYCSKPTKAKDMRGFLKDVLKKTGSNHKHEVFPKQNQLTTNKKYGNQMKGVLAIHPRTKKRAGIIKEGKVLNLEESLEYIQQFAETIKTAKQIDYRIEESTQPRNSSKKHKQKIPKKCNGMEHIACKQFLPSCHEAPKHNYIDGNAYQYFMHKDPKLFDAYAKIQKRQPSAFNGCKEWEWSCASIKKYLKLNSGDAIEQWKDFCATCKHNDQKEDCIYTSLYVDESKGVFLEQVFDPVTHNIQFCKFDLTHQKWELVDEFINAESQNIKPIRAEEVYKQAVLLPSKPLEYGTDKQLDRDIKQFINKWLDIPKEIKQFCVWNIKRSWVFERFHTLNYLRALGDTGEGKSRFLDTLGVIHYKPIATSGATTSAPVFRIISKWKGTLIIDEADFRKSDESEDMIKIINQGYEKKKFIMRCDPNKSNIVNFFDPFCPKILATRKSFQDKAVESRCITHVMTGTLRDDIPCNLNEIFWAEGLELRNKLLLWRFRNYFKIKPIALTDFNLGKIEPRTKQIVASFVSLFTNDKNQLKMFKEFILQHQAKVIEERKASFSGAIVNALLSLWDMGETKISASDIIEKAKLKDKDGNYYNPRSLTNTLRSLGLETDKPKKVSGRTKRCIILDEKHLFHLAKRYGYEVTKVTVVTGTSDQKCKDKKLTSKQFVEKKSPRHRNDRNLRNSVTAKKGEKRNIKDIVKYISQHDNGEGIPFEQIQKDLAWNDKALVSALDSLKQRGDVFSNRPDHWKII